ncbi:ABC transporter ATP-binding protein [Bacillus sp. 2205SS5-2]|uniref:ABC transporter ATP-binding protein n=1 Tax=Bacillus sp. 2205SS5-2 TaxID=3109031 RepID=UPI0030063E4F
MESIVSIQNVTKKIGKKTIIDSLSFDVVPGEVFGFLGPNGAGKTTTIRMMVGLISMTSGDIQIAGKSIKTDYEKAIANVGAIVENPELYKFLTGYKNLLHFARMHGNVSKEKIDEMVELVGLTDRIHDKVKTYSLGMRQRLGLAQALLHDPKILILDEPTNGLDPAGIREIRDYVRQLAKERNIAVIVSSHLLSEMEMMCDRIGIIQNGKLVDVQMVSDFVDGSEQVYQLEVSPLAAAEIVMKEKLSHLTYTQLNDLLHVQLEKEEIPALVKTLVDNEIALFSVTRAAKTLEDRFLEITDEKGAKAHA